METDQFARCLCGLAATFLWLVLDPSVGYTGASTLSRAVTTHENLQPAIPRPDQDRGSAQKRADL